jgi:hypothetical protein
LTNCGHPLEGELGNRTLLFGQRREHLAEMLLAWSQALGLGSLGQLRRWCEVRPVRTLPALASLVVARRPVVATGTAALTTTTAVATWPVAVAIVALVAVPPTT